MCRRVSENMDTYQNRTQTKYYHPTPKLYDCDPKDGGICTEGLAPMGKALKFSDNAIETTTVLAEIQCYDTIKVSFVRGYDVLG
jgi:hypothetical protein